MNLWTLYRRRKLAYFLLEEYDRDSVPFDFEAAMAQLRAFAATGDWPASKRNGYKSWREATAAKAGLYP